MRKGSRSQSGPRQDTPQISPWLCILVFSKDIVVTGPLYHFAEKEVYCRLRSWASSIYEWTLVSLKGDHLRRIFLIIMMLFCAIVCSNGHGANPPVKGLGRDRIKQSDSGISASANNSSVIGKPQNIIVLEQDNGKNLTKLNFVVAVSLTGGSAQTVKFTSPKPDLRLSRIMVITTNRVNASNEKLPSPLPFSIEIHDANLRLIYQYADAQFSYFTTRSRVRMANIDAPDIPINGDFIFCFYDYRSLGNATEIENVSRDSYLFDELTGIYALVGIPLRKNQTLPMNRLIRITGDDNPLEYMIQQFFIWV